MSTVLRAGDRPVSQLYCDDRAVTSVIKGTTQIWPDVRPVVLPSCLFFTLTSELTQNLYFTQSTPNGVVVNWGDGSAPDSSPDLTVSLSHTYAEAGDYEVILLVEDGVTWEAGAKIGNSSYGLIGYYRTAKGDTFPTLTRALLAPGLTGISAYGFAACTSLTEIVLPDSLTEIGQYAFFQSGVEEIIIPESVTSMGIYCFYDCTSLQSVRILAVNLILGEPTTFVFSALFTGCTSLKNVEIAAETIKSAELFMNCTALEKVWLRSTVDHIENYTYTNSEEKTYTYGPFTGSSAVLVIYCEDAAAQVGWESYWKKKEISEETSGFVEFPVVYNQAVRPW